MLKSIIACVVVVLMAAFMAGSTGPFERGHEESPHKTTPVAPDGILNGSLGVGRRERVALGRKERSKLLRMIDRMVGRRHERTLKKIVSSTREEARGESKKKAMFHPTQPLTLKFIARMIRLNIPSPYSRAAPQSIVIGDTSVGDGVTLANLKRLLIEKYLQTQAQYRAQAIDEMIHLVGIEPNLARARKARSQGIKVLAGTLEETKQQADALDMVFANPPYDADGATGGRTEDSHVRLSLQFLKESGLFVLIITKGGAPTARAVRGDLRHERSGVQLRA